MKLDLDGAVEEMWETPSEDVANRAHKCMESVLQVAKVSRNLQGTKVKELKQASVVGAAAIEVLRSRSDDEPDNDIARQVQSLRKELEKAREEARLAREETQRLKKELDEEREVRKKERGRRSKISDSLPPRRDRELLGTRKERLTKGPRKPMISQCRVHHQQQKSPWRWRWLHRRGRRRKKLFFLQWRNGHQPFARPFRARSRS